MRAGDIRQAQHHAGLSRFSTHGYREIFIPSQWAPVATVRKSSHPRDKDSSMTYPDIGASAAAAVAWDMGCQSHSASPQCQELGCWQQIQSLKSRTRSAETMIRTPRRLLRILTYPCFTMSLKLEAIPDRQRPCCPQRAHSTLSGFQEGCGEGQDRD